MPIYEYVCVTCKNEFEVLYKSHSAVKDEEPQELCPKCGSRIKERVISKGTSFQLKGSGWARDKYGK